MAIAQSQLPPKAARGTGVQFGRSSHVPIAFVHACTVLGRGDYGAVAIREGKITVCHCEYTRPLSSSLHYILPKVQVS